MNKPKLRVSRQGGTITVLMDPMTDQPISTTAYGEAPEELFACIKRVGEFEAEFGPAYDIEYVYPPQGQDILSNRHKIPQDVKEQAFISAEKELAALTGKQQPSARSKGIPVTAQVPASEPSAESMHQMFAQAQQVYAPQAALWGQAQVELSTMFAQRSVASGKLRKELDQEINAICNFLIRVWPELEMPLQELSERHSAPQRRTF